MLLFFKYYNYNMYLLLTLFLFRYINLHKPENGLFLPHVFLFPFLNFTKAPL